ncbi:MAG: transcriptional regulator, AraC family, partial [Chitinophagaceae bacterium]|nr:transcriptional regulator, AraC family [Chitinophagaceae bacterium]
AGNADTLELDERIMVLLEKVIRLLSNFSQPGNIAENLKKFHLVTVESARDYMLSHFQKNISLQQLAQHCHVSAFHFSRIFKSIQHVSPHQFLCAVRLNHAKILLETTELPVGDMAFECGFNSLEHFVTAYKKNFNMSPTAYRGQFA